MEPNSQKTHQQSVWDAQHLHEGEMGGERGKMWFRLQMKRHLVEKLQPDVRPMWCSVSKNGWIASPGRILMKRLEGLECVVQPSDLLSLSLCLRGVWLHLEVNVLCVHKPGVWNRRRVSQTVCRSALRPKHRTLLCVHLNSGIKHTVSCCYRKLINNDLVWWSGVTVTALKWILFWKWKCFIPLTPQRFKNEYILIII